MPHKTNYRCPCGAQLKQLLDTVPGPKPQVDDIILCGMCGKPLIVDTSEDGVREMTTEEFDKLEDSEQGDLMFAQRQIIAAAKRYQQDTRM